MSRAKVPAKAWRVVFAGTAINLCLGVLYAWSVWVKYLKNAPKAGQPIPEFPGWEYLTASEASMPFSLCVIMISLIMPVGGRIQDRMGPRVGAITGGLILAAGCLVAGLSRSYTGLIIGFGIMNGIGMAIGYAAPLPAALKWFGPHQRGLVAGLVVSGYGGAALYISPLAEFLIRQAGLTASFVFLGLWFGVVTMIAGSLLAWPEPGYIPPAPLTSVAATAGSAHAIVDWLPSKIVKTWQFYALIFLFIGGTQSGLLLIANAAPILSQAAKTHPFLAANAWILASYGALFNAAGRIGNGLFSDIIGRDKLYMLIHLLSALCLFLLPWIIGTGSLFWLFLAVGLAYWQYGGTMALLPSYTADFYGSKNLGMNYGLVFLGWGLGFFMAQLGGYIEDFTGSLNYAFYISAFVLIISVILAQFTRKPIMRESALQKG